MTASAAAGLYAASLDVRPEAMPGLSSMLLALSSAAYLCNGVAVFVLIDVVRRTGVLYSIAHSARLFGCASLSALALLLPPNVFVRVAVPRIAAVETDQRLAALLEVHGSNQFWRCWKDHGALVTAKEANGGVIKSDLRRYGLVTDLGVVARSDPGCTWDFSLYAWTHDDDRVRRVRIQLFEERVKNVEAAKQYVRGWSGPYDIPGLIYPAVLAALGGLVATVAASPMVVRMRAWARGGRRTTPGRRPLPWGRLDRLLASRWPMLWSSRVHFALPILALIPAVFWLSSYFNASIANSLTGSLQLIVLSLALLTQQQARHLQSRTLVDVGVLAIHSIALLSVTTIAMALRDRSLELNVNTLLAAWYILFLCAALQAARSGTALTALAGIAVVFAGFSGLALLDTDERVSSSEGLWIAVACVCGTALLAFGAVWLQARATVRRVFISSFIVLGPMPGIVIALGTMTRYGDIDDATVAVVAAGFLLGIGSTALFLRLTEGARRALASAG
jgi:hypothetical protein